uniref:Leucine-rich repeat-containing protein-like n=1 Tax=Phallusia mammillata TaxID=59560 RepID=A0A6F9DK05_9ASCI|nr:leucine-rich repeat-containing protein-like [Phallusia mammillata]
MPEPSEGEGSQEMAEENKESEEKQTEDDVPEESTPIDMETRASPTARPQSRGSVSPSRKTISRLGSGHSSHLTRPHTASSMFKSGSGKDERVKIEILEDKSDDGYDTDLEVEESKDEYDATGKTTYRDACKQYGVIPVSYFLRHMQDSELIMRHHGLGPAGAKAIAVSLVSNTKILKLDLSDNWLNPQGGIAISDMLIENCYISELILSDNHLQCAGAKAICETLQENVTINRVTLSGNDFDDAASVPLSEFITTTQKIEQLDLSNNNFGQKAGKLFGPAISENTSIKDLNLSWNQFRRAGAEAIAAGIGANIFLKSVNLSWNGLGLEGAKALGDALRNNNVLEELDVRNNRISTEGAVLLAKGLLSNQTLRILKIGKNPIQSAGAFGIVTALRQNTESLIEHLDFSDVVVNKDFVELEKEVKEARPKLVIIHGGAETDKVKPKPRADPMSKLRQYIEDNNLRLVDFFNQFDEDHSMTVTREEFQKGVETAGILLTNDEMHQLLDQLDKDGDGEINYSELVIGSLEHMQKEKLKREQSVNSDY